ncbi:MAG: hemolysin III family protein [Spirochaetaceae bacterium]|nr:hemolysin III family protein [Spirochaetaceae bacterium]
MYSLSLPRSARGLRSFTQAEETAHSASHALGAALALPGTVALVAAAIAKGDALDVLGAAIFGAALAILFSASAIYHGLREPRAKRLMQTADHDAIYVLIAGTYTPFCLTALRGGSGLLVLGIIWALAGIGITIRTVFPGRFRIPALACYLVMGWLVAFFFAELRSVADPRVTALLLAGGIAYSVGALVYVFESIPWFHTLWHVFVLAGAGCHFFSVLIMLSSG